VGEEASCTQLQASVEATCEEAQLLKDSCVTYAGWTLTVGAALILETWLHHGSKVRTVVMVVAGRWWWWCCCCCECCC